MGPELTRNQKRNGYSKFKILLSVLFIRSKYQMGLQLKRNTGRRPSEFFEDQSDFGADGKTLNMKTKQKH